MELVKRIPNVIEIHAYYITFSYETIKGYYREQQRKIYAASKGIAEWNFGVWAKKQRTMTNVEILAIVESTKDTKVFNV